MSPTLLHQKLSPLILASGSPTRARMLKEAGIEATVVNSHVDEDALKKDFSDLSPRELVRALAKSKALEVSRDRPEAYIIAADQILVVGTRVYDKPHGRPGAVARLMDLRGKTHFLFTATVLYQGERCLFSTVDEAVLELDYLDHGTIRNYVESERSWDSVGGYHIEGAGRELFRRVEGAEDVIRGLNVEALKDLIFEK